MKGIIIIGYPGIGKTSCGGKENCIDLDSSNFIINGHRDDLWHWPYCDIAYDLAEQGYTVFVSSHEKVMTYLRDTPNVFVFCPRLTMKNDWINRLEERYLRTKDEKDHRALQRVIEHYEEDITSIFSSNFPVIQPESIDYDLMEYVKKIRSWIK